MTPSVSLSLEVAYIWAFISLRCWKRDVVGGADMALDAGSVLASAPCRCECREAVKVDSAVREIWDRENVKS